MSARCGKCGASVEDPARCSNGHPQPLGTIDRLAEPFGENVDYDLLAEKVVERLRHFIPDLVAQVPAEPRLVDANEIARMVGKRREWVYAHKDELGALPLGKGRRPRWGFSPDLVMARLAERGADQSSNCVRTQGSSPTPLPDRVPLLPVKDQAA